MPQVFWSLFEELCNFLLLYVFKIGCYSVKGQEGIIKSDRKKTPDIGEKNYSQEELRAEPGSPEREQNL